eukprot:jgi/Chlat1/2806/Chrsp187S02918
MDEQKRTGNMGLPPLQETFAARSVDDYQSTLHSSAHGGSLYSLDLAAGRGDAGGEGGEGGEDKEHAGHLGTINGVLIPTCENMWGVLIFLRFFYIVGNAGVLQAFVCVLVSAVCAFLTVLSLSAVATNGRIKHGGAYYLISRALGPRIGGAVGGMYFLGVTLLAVLETLGAVEVLLVIVPSMRFTSANRVYGAIILVILGVWVFCGIKFVSKLGSLFAIGVAYALLSLYVGLFTAPKGSDPDTVIYTTYFGLWGAVAQRDYLLNGAGEAESHSGRRLLSAAGGDATVIVGDIAWPAALPEQIGIIMASVSQALQCLIVAPKLMQAMASDGTLPIAKPLAKLWGGEPRRALMATTLLAVAGAMIGSLDSVAPLVSICFLQCYVCMNLSCAVNALLRAPSWRPTWRYFHWSTAMFGSVACFALMFFIRWYWAIIALVMAILLYIYIDFKQVQADWGTGIGGLRLQLAVQAIHSLSHELQYGVNWRPQVLCLSRPQHQQPSSHTASELLGFVYQLKKGRGLCVIASIMEGSLVELSDEAHAMQVDLNKEMVDAGVKGFASVVVSPSFRTGKSYAIQCTGLGALNPNTVLMGWPKHDSDRKDDADAEIILELLEECKAKGKALLLPANLHLYPKHSARLTGTIDIWWIVHDGGLLMLVAHILQRHKIWKNCRLRVFTVAERVSDPAAMKENLTNLLKQAHIVAEVEVVAIDDGELAPYTFDWTIRVEEAQAIRDQFNKVKTVANDATSQKRSASQILKQFGDKVRSGGSAIKSKLVKLPSMQPLSRRSSLRASRSHGDGRDHLFPQELQMVPGVVHVPRAERQQQQRRQEQQQQKGGNANPRSFAAIKALFGPETKLGEKLAKIGSRPGSRGNSPPPSPRATNTTTKQGKSSSSSSSPAAPKDKLKAVPKLGKHKKTNSLTNLNFHIKQEEPHNDVDLEAGLVDDTTQTHTTDTIERVKSQTGKKKTLKKISSASEIVVPRSGSPARVSIRRPPPPIRTVTFKQDESEKAKSEPSSPVVGQSMSPPTSHTNGPAPGSPEIHPQYPVISRRGRYQPGEAHDNNAVTLGPSDSLNLSDTSPPASPTTTFSSLRPPNMDGNGSTHGSELYPSRPGSSAGSPKGRSTNRPRVRQWGEYSENFSPEKLNSFMQMYSRNAELVIVNLPDPHIGMNPRDYVAYCESLVTNISRVLWVHGTGREVWRM